MAARGGFIQDRPSWFNPDKYAGFDWIESQPHQELQQLWSKALLVRRILTNPENHFPPNIKTECIEKLIQNPLDDCGFGMNYISHKEILWDKGSPLDHCHSYGQPTVSPTRYGQISNSVCDPTLLNPSMCLDDLYLAESPHAHRQAFLTINLAASDALIKHDFNNWLHAIRSYRNWPRTFSKTPEAIVKKWADYKLIACIDLIKIIGPAKGERISVKKATEWARVHPSYIRDSFISTTLPKAISQALKPNTSDYLA